LSNRRRGFSHERDLAQRLWNHAEFSRRAGGEAFIAVKIVGTGEWRFVSLNSLRETGSLKITKAHLSNSLKLEDVISIVKGVRRLDEFAEME